MINKQLSRKKLVVGALVIALLSTAVIVYMKSRPTGSLVGAAYIRFDDDIVQKTVTTDVASKVAGVKLDAVAAELDGTEDKGRKIDQVVYDKNDNPPGQKDPSKMKRVLVTARLAKTPEAADLNKQEFRKNVVGEVQDVTGYGESAYWDPDFGQLHILKNGNWFILQSGGMLDSLRTLDETKKLADEIINKL